MGKKLYAGLLVLSLAILMSTPGEAVECPTPPVACVDQGLVVECTVCFSGGNDTFTFSVDATPKGTRLTRGRLMVDTRDTGNPGDLWGVQVTEPTFPAVIVLPLEKSLRGERVCGDGNTTEFSGAETVLRPGGVEMATVKLSQCSSEGTFPADAIIRFQYTGDALTVTPPE
jgi:hypothetical protein